MREPDRSPRGRRPALPLDKRCAALVDELRDHCPGVLPEKPLPPGEVGRPVPVDPKPFAQLLGLAARQTVAQLATGRLPTSDDELPGVVVWEDGSSALAVSVAQLAASLDEGTIAVALPVSCDQVADRAAAVTVVFAVGSPDRPAGLLAATPRQPEGPQAVLDGWAEQLIALAWQAVLDATAAIAAQSGTDADGTPLVATALAASKSGVEVTPQARHGFDRILTGRAVAP